MAMSLSLAVTAGAAFNDQAKIVNDEAVDMCSALGIINGYTDGSFKPEGNVTRAEAAKMICIALNGGKEPVLSASATPVFADIAGHWAAKYIEYCNSLGIVAGKSATQFDPNGNVTGTVYETELNDEDVYAVDVWTGTETVTLYQEMETEVAVPTAEGEEEEAAPELQDLKAGDFRSYQVKGDYVETLTVNAGEEIAITGFEAKAEGYVYADGNETAGVKMDKDIVIIGVNTAEKEGDSTSIDTIELAEETEADDEVSYVDNAFVIYGENDDGDTVIVALFYDVENELA